MRRYSPLHLEAYRERSFLASSGTNVVIVRTPATVNTATGPRYRFKPENDCAMVAITSTWIIGEYGYQPTPGKPGSDDAEKIHA